MEGNFNFSSLNGRRRWGGSKCGLYALRLKPVLRQKLNKKLWGGWLDEHSFVARATPTIVPASLFLIQKRSDADANGVEHAIYAAYGRENRVLHCARGPLHTYESSRQHLIGLRNFVAGPHRDFNGRVPERFRLPLKGG